MSYAGLTKTTTNDLAQSFVEIKDSQGQIVQVIDADNNASHYTYDAFGNLVQTTDAAGNTTTMSYDLRGRKIAMDDPDMGQWSYRYDVLGQLLWQQDAKQQVVTMAYDKLGRMTQRSEAEGLSQWTYDTKPKGIGKLALVNSPGGYQQEAFYDSLGRPSSTTTTIAGSVYTESVAYDTYGRVQTQTYPTGFAVKNVYNSRGYLTEIRKAANDALYWQANYVDASGNVGEETLGNGLSTIRTFDAETGRLTAIVTGATGQVQLASYQYDTLGNLKQRRDDNRGLTENFGYDNLNRLTSAAIVGGETKTYSYNAIGNITQKSDIGSYTYGQNGAGAHAVTQAGNTTFTYDANGNQISGDGRTLAYTSFNKPSRITKGSTVNDYQYGAGHQRIVKTSNKNGNITITHYLSKAYERVQTPTGVIEHKHYIAAGGSIVLYTERSNSTSLTQYIHKDHLGSTDVITNGQGQITERLSFDPWGARRKTDWTSAANFGSGIASAVTRGFTGHDQDDAVGLINMNARMYDAKFGRFLQPDTVVQFPYTTQGMNRYTYVNNNPLSFTDPTGHFLKKLFKGVKKLFKNKVFRMVVTVVAAYLTWGAALMYSTATTTLAAAQAAAGAAQFAIAGAAGGFVGGLVSSGGDLKAALIGGVTGAMFGVIGGSNYFGPVGDVTAQRVIAHGVVGGISSRAQGGDFARGFVTSAFTKSVAGKIQAQFNGNPVGGAIASAVVGGTAAEITGGKFANGAMNGAFAYLFNQTSGVGGRSSLTLFGIKISRTVYDVTLLETGETLKFKSWSLEVDTQAFAINPAAIVYQETTATSFQQYEGRSGATSAGAGFFGVVDVSYAKLYAPSYTGTEYEVSSGLSVVPISISGGVSSTSRYEPPVIDSRMPISP